MASVTALIQFDQGGPGTPGQAFVGATGSLVTVTNDSNLNVNSWQIDLVYTPPGSAVPVAVPLAFNDAGSTPTASFTPDVVGSYRLVLTVWAVINRTGNDFDRDIRNFVIPLPSGLIIPPYQKDPDKLPTLASGRPGAKPNELNIGGTELGWAGDGSDGLLAQAIMQIGAGGGGPLAATLALGNTTGGNNIVVSAGDVIQGATSLDLTALGAGGNVNLTPGVGGEVVVNGKLTVTGLIDPTGLVLDEQAVAPFDPTGLNKGLLYVKSGAPNTLWFRDDSGAEAQVQVGAGATPALSVVLGVGNTTSGTNIVISAGDSIQGSTDLNLTALGAGGNVNLTPGVGGEVVVSGKLTVTGLIDPTGLVLDEQAVAPFDPTGLNKGLLYVKSGAPNTLWFRDDSGAEAQVQVGAGGVPSLASVLGVGNTTIGGGNTIDFANGDFIRVTGDGSNFAISYSAAATAAGGSISITAQTGGGAGAGGNATFQAGTGGATGVGGNVVIAGGAGGATSGAGGSVTLQGGLPVDGNGGGITLTGRAGVGTDRNGGGISLTAGASTGAGTPGVVTITAGQGGTTGTGGTTSIFGGPGGSVSGAGGTVILQGGLPVDGAGGAVSLLGRSGIGTNRAGGDVTISSGASTGSGTAGVIGITAGAGGSTAVGGSITLTAGAGGSTSGAGGAINLVGGSATDGNGGGVSITGAAGTGTNRSGGVVNLTAGAATGSGTAGTVSITAGAGGTTSGNGGSITLAAGAAGAASGGNGGDIILDPGAGDGGGTAGVISATSSRITSLADATADQDALNRRSLTGVNGGVQYGSVQTTNATPTTLITYAGLNVDGFAVTLFAEVTGLRDNDAEAAGYFFTGTFRRAGGTITQVGSTLMISQNEDVGAWDATMTVSGTNILIQVTGAAVTIDWQGVLRAVRNA